MKELSNFDMDRIFKGNKHYGGTFSKDVLPKLQNKFYIINLDNNDGDGTHWCLVYNCRPKQCLYFDSFGQPSPENVLKRMKQIGKHIYYNDMQIQNINSSNCGYYCVYVACNLALGRPYIDVILDFDPNTKSNETKIENYSKSHDIRADFNVKGGKGLKDMWNKYAPSFLKPKAGATKGFDKFLNA